MIPISFPKERKHNRPLCLPLESPKTTYNPHGKRAINSVAFGQSAITAPAVATLSDVNNVLDVSHSHAQEAQNPSVIFFNDCLRCPHITFSTLRL